MEITQAEYFDSIRKLFKNSRDIYVKQRKYTASGMRLMYVIVITMACKVLKFEFHQITDHGGKQFAMYFSDISYLKRTEIYILCFYQIQC